MGMRNYKGSTGAPRSSEFSGVVGALMSLTAARGRLDHDELRLGPKSPMDDLVAHGIRSGMSQRPSSFRIALQNGRSSSLKFGHSPRLNSFFSSSRPPASLLNQC